MSNIFMIYFTFWTMGVYPLGNALGERPKDWRLWLALVGMIGAAVVAILMDKGVEI